MAYEPSTLGALLRAIEREQLMELPPALDKYTGLHDSKKETNMFDTNTVYHKVTLLLDRFISDERHEFAPENNIDLLKKDNRIAFIKLLRKITGLGLKESKEIADWYYDNYTKPMFDEPNPSRITIHFVLADKYAARVFADMLTYCLDTDNRYICKCTRELYEPIPFCTIA